MYDQEQVEEIVRDYEEGNASLGDLADAFDNWDGDPFAVL